MIDKPIISVIMANYNGGIFLEDAIKSILDQIFFDFEFIIADDYSNDKSISIIEKYSKKDKRIILIKNSKNLGICHSLNKAINKANGKYIARMDSDDISLKNRLKLQLEFMEKNREVGVCGSNCININQKGEEIGRTLLPSDDNKCRKSIRFRNPFKHSSTMIRKECFEKIGLYDDKYKYAEDLDLWIRIGKKYKLANLDNFLIKYRIHGGNAILKKQKDMINKTLKIRKKAIKLGYNITLKGKLFFLITYISQFFPSKLVLFIFNKFTKS